MSPEVSQGRQAKPFPKPVSAATLLTDSFVIEKKIELNSAPLGDLLLKSVQLFPKELEEGVWPDKYSLSDHGIVECIFIAKVNKSVNQNYN